MDRPPFEVDAGMLSALAGDFFSPDLIAAHVERWDFRALSANPHLPWSAELIGRFADAWDWVALSGNRGVPFERALWTAFCDRWVVPRLAANDAVPWDRWWVERAAARLAEPDPSWHPAMAHERPVTVAPGVTLTDSGWGHLMQNPRVAWDEVLPLLPAPDWRALAANPGFRLPDERLDRHAPELSDAALSRRRDVEWTPARIDRLLDAPSPAPLHLSANPSLPWSEALVRRHAERWVFEALSGNPAIPWTVALLEEHIGRVRWDRLSRHAALTPPILDRFAAKLDWSWGVSCNRATRWTAELMTAHAERLDWERLSWHPGLPWSEELLVAFADRWVVRSFGRNEEAFRVAEPHLDEAWLRGLLDRA